MRGFEGVHEAVQRSMREEAVRMVLVAEGRDVSRVLKVRMQPGESCETFCNHLRQLCRMRGLGDRVRPRVLGLCVKAAMYGLEALGWLVAGVCRLTRSTERFEPSRFE